MKKALTIAGFDPSGGAGLQADLKVFHALGLYGLSAVAALTAQNTEGVAAVEPVSSLFLKKQLDVLLADLTPDAVKIGMLLTKENVSAMAAALKKHALANVVLDPVVVSSSGRSLAGPDVPGALRRKLFPLCRVITPNLSEAALLSGIGIRGLDDMKRAAELLRKDGPEVVIITGGHLEGRATDLVCDGSFHLLSGAKRPGEYHGTGCTFSAAVAAFLAQGCGGLEAAQKAKRFMRRAFGRTIETGRGMKLFVI